MRAEEHWNRLWNSKQPAETSWFEAEPATSLQLIRAAALAKDSAIIDVGGGASHLVDRLLDGGFRRLTVVDISESALRLARTRLGPRAAQVTWLVADVRELQLPEPVDLWHDRAVFHFLIQPADQDAYLSRLREAVRAGGHVVMATFGLPGPERCSGLPVARYDADGLSARLGAGYELLRSLQETHTTPGGAAQPFTYCLFRGRESQECRL